MPSDTAGACRVCGRDLDTLDCQCDRCEDCGRLVQDCDCPRCEVCGTRISALNVAEVCDTCAARELREVELKHARDAMLIGVAIGALIVLAYAAYHFS